MNISLGFLLHIHSSYNTYTIAPFFQASFGPCIVVNRKWLLKKLTVWCYTYTLPAWWGLMYHKSPRDLTPAGCNYCYFLKLEAPLITSIFWVIWGVKPLFVVQKRGDVTPTEIMLGLAGGMKVNCYLKIIYLQLQEWSTHRYD